jgi:hypothetical protein
MAPPKRQKTSGHQNEPIAVDIRGRLHALHARIGEGGLEPLARMDLPKLERALLSLMADVTENAHDGAPAARAELAGKTETKSRFKIRGVSVEPPESKERSANHAAHVEREEKP